MLLKWINRLIARNQKTNSVANLRSKFARSYIVVNHDGSTKEFLFGTVGYGKGCEPVGGHKPKTTIELSRNTHGALPRPK